jgi:hypothetical protein
VVTATCRPHTAGGNRFGLSFARSRQGPEYTGRREHTGSPEWCWSSDVVVSYPSTPYRKGCRWTASSAAWRQLAWAKRHQPPGRSGEGQTGEPRGRQVEQGIVISIIATTPNLHIELLLINNYNIRLYYHIITQLLQLFLLVSTPSSMCAMLPPLWRSLIVNRYHYWKLYMLYLQLRAMTAFSLFLEETTIILFFLLYNNSLLLLWRLKDISPK